MFLLIEYRDANIFDIFFETFYLC